MPILKKPINKFNVLEFNSVEKAKLFIGGETTGIKYKIIDINSPDEQPGPGKTWVREHEGGLQIWKIAPPKEKKPSKAKKKAAPGGHKRAARTSGKAGG